jgi:MarR family transcriptional regulator, organic hydroperoxide resistance regulator
MNGVQNTDDRRVMVKHLSHCVRRLLVERERLAQRFAVKNGLSSTDFRALIHISESELNKEPLAAGGLRELMNMSAGAATYVVDRLVNTGHVRREDDPFDRRKVVLRHTAEGDRTTGEFFAAIEHRNRAALSDVTAEDLATTERVICHLIDYIRQSNRR